MEVAWLPSSGGLLDPSTATLRLVTLRYFYLWESDSRIFLVSCRVVTQRLVPYQIGCVGSDPLTRSNGCKDGAASVVEHLCEAKVKANIIVLNDSKNDFNSGRNTTRKRPSSEGYKGGF